MKRRRSERRSRSRPVARAAIAVALSVGLSGRLPGQTTGAGTEESTEAGASFLLVPIGARIVGTGGAGVADPSGANGFFANPAAFSRLTRRDASFDFGLDDAADRYVATLAVPIKIVGTLAATGYLYNAGTQETTDENNTVVGRAVFRDVAVAASYATRFGRRFHAGLSYKYVQYRFDCSGVCTRPGDPEQLARVKPSTSAVDFGAQLDPRVGGPLHFGVAVRNLGLRLQVRDRAQADRLPTQLAGGVAYDVPNVAKYLAETSVRLVSEFSTGVGVRLGQTYHLGAEATYRRAVSLRAGYAKRDGGYGGPAIGFGLARKELTLDIARQVAASGLLVDKPPTYVGLRYSF